MKDKGNRTRVGHMTGKTMRRLCMSNEGAYVRVRMVMRRVNAL